MNVFRPKNRLGLLLIVYVLLALNYSLHTPLFEAPDEYYHFAVIQHLAQTGSFPPRPPRGTVPLLEFGPHPQHPWRYMSFRTPLYYLLALPMALPFRTPDFPSKYRLNPHGAIGVPLTENNANFVAHIGSGTLLGISMRDPWDETALAVRSARLASIALGIATLLGVYALSLEVFPARRDVALLALLIVMLIPQFLFISAVVNDENAVITFST